MTDAIIIVASSAVLFFGSYYLISRTLHALDRVVNRKHYDDYYDVQFPFTINEHSNEGE